MLERIGWLSERSARFQLQYFGSHGNALCWEGVSNEYEYYQSAKW